MTNEITEDAFDVLRDLLETGDDEMRLEAATTIVENAWMIEEDTEPQLYLGDVQLVEDTDAQNRVTVYDTETGDEVGEVSAGEIRDLSIGSGDGIGGGGDE